MKERVKLGVFITALGFALAAHAAPAKAQTHTPKHVVPREELSGDIARTSEARRANEAAIRHLLLSEPGQQALQSAKVDYTKVDKAIRQLSDEEAAKLASRAQQAEQDFAAGFISAKTLAYIILALVVIITLVVLIT